jgi:organic radical activating enzyme
MNSDLIYDIIDSKVIKFAELVICLFEHCNLRCVFCPQDHDSVIGASKVEILSKVAPIVKWINENNRSTYFKIHIMGGELFQDRWIDKGFIEIYHEFITQIRQQVPESKTIVFNFVTNLLFENTKPVYQFIDNHDCMLSVSYDPKGRFSKNDFELFKQNVEIFKSKMKLISCVMTSQNIEFIMKGDDYFTYLYNNFPVDWDSYLPSTKAADYLVPKESRLLEFYKFLVDRYPKCLNILFFTESKTENKMSCTRGNSFTILPDNSNPAGCSGSVLLTKPKSNDLGSGAILEKFFQKYNCFECEFFKRCPFTCFIKHEFSGAKDDLDVCMYKETFRYVDSKKET